MKLALHLSLFAVQAHVNLLLRQQPASARFRCFTGFVGKQAFQFLLHVGIGIHRVCISRQVSHQFRVLAFRAFQLRVARLADALILGLALRLWQKLTIVCTLVLQQLALDGLGLRCGSNDFFFNNFLNL